MKPLPRNSSRWLIVLLFGSLLALAARSYFYTDIPALFIAGGKAHALVCNEGGIGICLTDVAIDRTGSWPLALYLGRDLETGEIAQLIKDRSKDHWEKFGVIVASGKFDQADWPSVTGFTIVGIPFWMLLLAASPPAYLAARRLWDDRQRRKLGLCPECGYDLRATQQRCPECGRATTPA